jgi:hypothetical protein
VPLGLIGAGLVWLMRSQRGQGGWSQGAAGAGGYAAGGTYVSHVPAEVQEHGMGIASSAAERAREITGSVRERAREMTGSVRERASDMGSAAREATTRQLERARHGLGALQNEQPLLLGLGVLALGAIVGGLLPPSRREDELLGRQRDDLLGHAAATGREKAEEVRRAAEASARRGNGQAAAGIAQEGPVS